MTKIVYSPFLRTLVTGQCHRLINLILKFVVAHISLTPVRI